MKFNIRDDAQTHAEHPRPWRYRNPDAEFGEKHGPGEDPQTREAYDQWLKEQGLIR